MSELSSFIVNADQEGLSNYYSKNIQFIEKQPGVQPRILPLILLAVGGLTTSTAITLEGVAWSVLGGAVASAVIDVYNQKLNTSSLSYPTGTDTITNWETNLTNIPGTITSSGAKHIDRALTQSVSTQIKNDNNNNGNLEIYTNSMNGSNLGKNILVVYDIKTSTSGIVNRHLGNTVAGTKVDANYADETLDLKGYTVFIIYNHLTQQVFHAHFVPTASRATELKWNRYLGNFNVRIYPSILIENEYNANNGRTASAQQLWEQRYSQAKSTRDNNVLRSDSKGSKSVVPKI